MTLGAAGPIETLTLDRLDMWLDPGPCALSAENRPAIDAHFADRVAAQPGIWNGPILLMVEHRIEAGVLTGRYAQADYASLLWLLATEPPHAIARNAFAMGALRGADGGFVLARMAPWTANAGRIYFAAGTPDPSDVMPDGRVDLDGSLLRELTEETGIAAHEVTPATQWTALRDARRLALLREIVADLPAEALADRIRAHIASEERPEIDAVIVARGPDDLAEGMPPFIRSYLLSAWGHPGNAA
ncbi:NUDIX hydrolase [Ancylobacter sp. SL191]|uniref:NUDIX hydrolase n=1 Tax=Ancylobacter sp. SL191 TaxID=2995166 RepID=UPI00226F5F80|nr:NUDIX hydrolase [Ancylobacter sp. SL191]WAC25833.1 NUDIX hydrolase [Ancylobacter sp. SL191]